MVDVSLDFVKRENKHGAHPDSNENDIKRLLFMKMMN